jgi:transcriptional regulator with XRE-family HTH domain
MIGYELRQLRRSTGLTQAALAELLGVATKTVNAWENGHVAVTRITEIACRHVLAEIAERRPSTIPPAQQRPGWQRRLRKWLLSRV